MVNSARKYVVVFTLLIIAALLFIQVRWIVHSVRFQKKVFQKTVTLALNQTIAHLTRNEGICSKMQECIAFDSARFETQLTSAGVWDKIHEAIDEELQTYDINLEYGLYIIKKGTDTLRTIEKEIREGVYYSQCLKDIIETSDYELVVRFPNRSGFFFEKSGLMFISSVALILLIILSIGYLLSLYQKELRLADNTRELINNISHEFKTPISTIALAANMIRKKRFNSDEKLQEYSILISKENKKLQRQVESLLHLAAIERDEFDYNKEKADAHELIDDAVSTIEMFLWERGGTIQKKYEASMSEIFADKLHMSNAIVNLLSNAINYSEGEPEIYVRTFNSGNVVLIQVEDKGMGIPAKYQKYIFQKYYRVPAGDVHNIKGFGIGLSYVRKVLEAHDGEVSVESETGKGSIFTLKIPVYNG